MSAEKVEKVVKPPQNPTMSSQPSVSETLASSRMPISSEPAALTVNVPAGNPSSVCPAKIPPESR